MSGRPVTNWLIMCAQLSLLGDKVWPFACPPTYPHLVKNVECSSPREDCVTRSGAMLWFTEEQTWPSFLFRMTTCFSSWILHTNRHLWDLIPTKFATLTWVVVWYTPPHSLGYQLCPQQRVSFLQSMLEEEVPAYELLHEVAHCSWTSPLQCALYCKRYIIHYPTYLLMS